MLDIVYRIPLGSKIGEEAWRKVNLNFFTNPPLRKGKPMITTKKEIELTEKLLREYKDFDCKLSLLQIERELILNDSYSIKGSSMDTEYISCSNNNNSPVERYVIAKENMLEDIERRENIIKLEKRKIDIVYNNLTSIQKRLFNLHFVECLNWLEVCHRMNIAKTTFFNMRKDIIKSAICTLNTERTVLMIEDRFTESCRIDDSLEDVKKGKETVIKGEISI